MSRETITVTVAARKYPQQAADFAGWAVLRTDHGVVVGNFAWLPSAGQRLAITGNWEVDPKRHGEQFRAVDAELIIPTNSRDLLAYACSITSGLGAAKEAEIWIRYGDNWPQASALEGIAGIRESTRNEWRETLQRIETERARSKAMAYLLGIGCTNRVAATAWARWDDKTVSIVADNVYRLTELPRVAFAAVDDRPRKSLDIADDDPRRHDAATLHALHSVTAGGNTIATVAEVGMAVTRLIGLEIDLPASFDRLNDYIVILDAYTVAERKSYADACAILAKVMELA